MTLKIQNQVHLAQYTSWQVGGNAEFFCVPKNLDEIIEAVQWAKSQKVKITILSGGTNVLISDSGIEGLVIYLFQFRAISHEIRVDRLFINANAGCGKSELLKIFLKYRLAPALFLAGLPGDVGGGVVMNAGVGELIEPREFCEIVCEVEVLNIDTLQIQKFTRDQIRWQYRHSEGWQPGIITNVLLSWPLVEKSNILEEVREANKNRFSKQPLHLPSCGSVFINPPGQKSARLIDEAGLKGFTIGGAQVSSKHANFIVNIGNARAVEISELIEYVKNVVNEKKGILLKTEVVYLGKW
jgi:UDP-N-acetylmuramate dehydrogenase